MLKDFDNDAADTPHVLAQVAQLSDALKVEFDIIGTRMTWLVISQSFMFSAFATAIATWSENVYFRGALSYLVASLPALGIVVGALVALGLRAAHKMAAQIKDDRDKLIETLPPKLRIRLVSSRESSHTLGNLPAAYIPWAIVLVWVGAVLSLPLPQWLPKAWLAAGLFQ